MQKWEYLYLDVNHWMAVSVNGKNLPSEQRLPMKEAISFHMFFKRPVDSTE